MIKKIILALAIVCYSTTTAQNTVGTTYIDQNVFDGFTLINVNTKAYLINNCGEVLNEWVSTYPPGNAVYLLPNGNLLRAGRTTDGSSDIVFGGQGGVVELFDWDGTLIWSFLYSTNEYRQHHDIFPMPNGNVLILAATVISEGDAIAAGRNPDALSQSRLYNEQIIEVEPVGTDQANIVWEWNIKDHLIQDFDATKANFGNVKLNPGKLDINFLNGRDGLSNWLHFNSIQYDDNLNQIVMSSRNLSEIYIIDHSTTTAEAATSSGGTYGRGGDLLYRWGNPQAYRQGTENDRKLYGQHYPHYIAQGLNDEGKLIIYNNGDGRQPEYSEVLIINPPTTTPGTYEYSTDTAFGPENPDYVYSEPSNETSNFYSRIVSSAQRLPNGNTLVCEGAQGGVFELDVNDNIVWKYQNPVNNSNGNISTQGGAIPNNALLFRALKYAPNYPAFAGKDLTPGLPIELNPNLAICENLSASSFDTPQIFIFPNPVSQLLTVKSLEHIHSVALYSMSGNQVLETIGNTLDVSALATGVYFAKINIGNRYISKKIIKQ